MSVGQLSEPVGLYTLKSVYIYYKHVVYVGQAYLLQVTYACLLTESIGHRPRNATVFCPVIDTP